MDEKLTALKLFLDELQVSSDITTVDDRKRVQKAIYLGQLAGVNLGYRFGWYVMGPYSPPLTRDYYRLAEEMEANPAAFEGMRFRKEVAEKLHALLPLFAVPQDLSTALGVEDWLELLASYHYLRQISGKDEEQALQTMKDRKGPLAPYVPRALTVLKKHALLAA
jgi:uncharacterized protein YwgA